MKIWQKIFLYTLLLFMVVYSFGIVLLIENNFNLSVQKEVELALDMQKNIAGQLSYFGMQAGNYTRPTNAVASDFFRQFKPNGVDYEIFDRNNQLIYSNSNVAVSGNRDELNNLGFHQNSYIIRMIDDAYFLFVAGLVNIGGETYKMSAVYEVSGLYQCRDEQFAYALKLLAVIAVVLAVLLYTLSAYITRPIDALIRATKTIAEGDYSRRVSLATDDEVGALVKNFNFMADAVESNVNQLKNIAEKKQLFIDNLAHELKNPLTSIIGYAELLRAMPYDEEKYILGLSHIASQAKRLEKLSSKMMNLVALRGGDFNMEPEHALHIFKDIRSQFAPRLEEKRMRFVISGEDVVLSVEKDLIRNLIGNLVDNAIKASPEGSTLYARVRQNDVGETVLEICDEGSGIPKEELPRVFDAFYMVDKARARANQSAGLGLALCMEIARIHHASLHIESELNTGTTVTVVFPGA